MALIVPKDEARRNGPLRGAVVHDLREPGAIDAFKKARAVWASASDVEAIDEDRYMLLILAVAVSDVPQLGTRAA